MSDYDLFAKKCVELGLPEDTRMDDFMEFLDAFSGEIREQVTQRAKRDLEWNYHNPTRSRPRGPDPDSEEAKTLIDAHVREDLRDCARKLAKLMDGIG